MPNVYWLSGNIKQRRPALDAIFKEHEGAEKMRFDEQVSYSYIEHCILSSSCFSDRRLFIIDAVPTFGTTKPTMLNHLKKLLQAIQPDTTVVFNGISPSDEQALFKIVGEVKAEVKDFPTTLDRRDATQWVMSQVSSHGNNITEEDASLLVEIAGYDPYLKGIGVDQLNLSIIKLTAYIGRRKNITRDDIVITAYPSEEFVVWRVLDALDSKNLESCQKAFHAMTSEADSVRSAAEQLIAITMPRFRMMLFLKEGLAKNMTKSQLAAELGSFTKLKQTGKDYKMKLEPDLAESGSPKQAFSPQYVMGTMDGFRGNQPLLDKYSRKDIYRIIGCLQDCAVEVRARTGDAGINLVIDTLFLTVCTNADEEHLKAVRRFYEP